MTLPDIATEIMMEWPKGSVKSIDYAVSSVHVNKV